MGQLAVAAVDGPPLLGQSEDLLHLRGQQTVHRAPAAAGVVEAVQA